MAGESEDQEDSRDLLVSRRLRSKGSYLHSYIRFVNCTQRLVDIVWLNHEGVSVRYKTLPSKSWVDVNTYVGHPWIFRDAITGDKLVVHRKEVFEPPAHCYERDGAVRRVVMITIPVYTLKECCLQTLRPIVPADYMENLELPLTLIEELQNSLERNRFLSNVETVQNSNTSARQPANH